MMKAVKLYQSKRLSSLDYTFETAPYVRPLACVHETRGAIGELLTPRPQRQGGRLPQRSAHIEERLVQIELIFVRWPGPARASDGEAALQLAKEAHVGAQVPVGVQHEARQQIAIGVLGPFPPVGMAEIFILQAHFAAE